MSIKNIVACVGLAAAAGLATGQVYDGFDYTPGTLGNANGGTGDWTSTYGNQIAPNPIGGSATSEVQAGSLVLPNFGLSTTGGKLFLNQDGDTDGDESARRFGSSVALEVGTFNGPVYFSFLVQRVSETGEFVFQYRRSNGSGFLTVGADDGDFTVAREDAGFLANGTIKVDGSTVGGGALRGQKAGFVTGTTYLYAGKLVRNSNGVSIFANIYDDGLDIPELEPTAWDFESYRNSSNSSVWDKLAFRALDGEFLVDELRLDPTGWSSVAAPIPAPGVFGLAGVAGLIAGRRRRA